MLLGFLFCGTLSSYAQNAVEVTPEFLRWEKRDHRLYLALTLSNLSEKATQVYGEVDLSTSQYRKRIRFEYPLAFQGERSLEVRGPEMDFLDEDFLVVSVQIFDANSKKALDQTDKFSVPLPRDPETLLRSQGALLLLFAATEDKATELAERTTKPTRMVPTVKAERHGEVLWQTEGVTSNWGQELVEGLNLRENAVEVVLKPQLVVRMSQPVVARSFRPSLVSLVGVEGEGEGVEVALTTKLENDHLLITPDQDLQRGTRYELSLSPGMIGNKGLKQTTARKWKFSTIGGVAGKFEVLESKPQNLETKVSISGPVRLLFTDLPDARSVEPTTVQLFKGEVQVPVRLRLRGKQLLFQPIKPLEFSTAYRFQVQGISDHQGREVLPFGASFTTEDKETRAKTLALKGMFPGPKTSGLSPETEIWVQFDQKVEPATVAEGAGLFEGDNRVEGSWVAEGDRIRFTPTAPLQYNKVYVVRLNEGLKSKEGGGLREDVAWPFATKKDLGYPEQIDPNVLIFSSSHELVSYLPQRKGTLKIGITAFGQIKQVDVNGKLLPIKPDTQVEFNLDYYLRQRTTKFQVSVVTEAGLGQKTFTINLGSKEEGFSSRLISIASVQNIDNVNSEAADQTADAATKSSITLVPQLQYRFSKNQAVALKGVILREKYSNSSFQALEAAFTQVALEWEAKQTWVGTAVTNLGWNDIRTDNSSPALGKSKLLAETYLNFEATQSLSKETQFKEKLEGKYSNTIAEAASVDDEADATVSTLTLQAKTKFFEVGHQFDFSYEINDAVGKYQDQTAYKLGVKFSKKLGPLSPSLNIYQKTTEYGVLNPTYGVALKNVSSQADLKVSWSILPKLQLGGEYKYKSQQSNYAAKTFTVSTYGLSLTHIW
ncbi:MAG: Ig-like domain-containing protein [bacterium]|nr:Ig-like domain-containing protein [bacterium]